MTTLRPIDVMLLDQGEKPVAWYMANNRCIRCGKCAPPMIDITRLEFKLSAFCPACQDHVFDKKPDPEGIDLSSWHRILDKLDVARRTSQHVKEE